MTTSADFEGFSPASDIELSGAAAEAEAFASPETLGPCTELVHGTFYVCQVSSGRYFACVDVETELGHMQLCIPVDEGAAQRLLGALMGHAGHATGWMGPADSVGWMGPATGAAPAAPAAAAPAHPAAVHTAAIAAAAPHAESAHPAVRDAVAIAAHGAAHAAAAMPRSAPLEHVQLAAHDGAHAAVLAHPMFTHPAVQAALPAAAFAAVEARPMRGRPMQPIQNQWRAAAWDRSWGARPAWYGAREWRGEWGDRPAWWGAREWRGEWGQRPAWWQPTVYADDGDEWGDDDDDGYDDEGDAYDTSGAAGSDVLAAAEALNCITRGNVAAFQQAFASSGLGHLAITGTLDHATQAALAQVMGQRAGFATGQERHERHHHHHHHHHHHPAAEAQAQSPYTQPQPTLAEDGFPVVHSLHAVANDVARRIDEAADREGITPEVRAAARIVAKAHLGDLQAGRFVGQAMREHHRLRHHDQYATGFDFGHAMHDVAHGLDRVGDTLLKGAEFVAKHVDLPMAIANAIPIPAVRGFMHSIDKLADPIYKFGEVVHAVRKGDLKGLRAIAQEQLSAASGVVSLIPGIGTAVGAAIGTAQALLDGGHPIEIALRAAYGALPIPPGLRQITDTVFDAIMGFIEHPHSLTDAALAVARDRIPSGIPRDVFDTLAHIIVKHQPIGKAAADLAGHYVRQFTAGVGPAIEHGLDHLVAPAAAAALRTLPAATMKYAGFHPLLKQGIAPATVSTGIAAPSSPLIGRPGLPMRGPMAPLARPALPGRFGVPASPLARRIPFGGGSVASPFGVRAPMSPFGARPFGAFGLRAPLGRFGAPQMPYGYGRPAAPGAFGGRYVPPPVARPGYGGYRPAPPMMQPPQYAPQQYAQPAAPQYAQPQTPDYEQPQAPAYEQPPAQAPAAASPGPDADLLSQAASALPAAVSAVQSAVAPDASAPAVEVPPEDDTSQASADGASDPSAPVGSPENPADADSTTSGYRGGRPRPPMGRGGFAHFGHRGRYGHPHPHRHHEYAEPYEGGDDDDDEDGDDLEQASAQVQPPAAPVAPPMQTGGAFDLGDPMTGRGGRGGRGGHHHHHRRREAEENMEDDETTSGAIDLDGPETMGRGFGGRRGGFGRHFGGHHFDRRYHEPYALPDDDGDFDDETTSGAFDMGDPMTTGLGTIIPSTWHPGALYDFEGSDAITIGRGHGGGHRGGFGRHRRGFGRGFGGYPGYPGDDEGDDDDGPDETTSGVMLPLLALGAAAGAGLYGWHEHEKAAAASAAHATAGAIDLDGPETMGRGFYGHGSFEHHLGYEHRFGPSYPYAEYETP